MVKEAIEDICSRGKIPILAGGTGFYIQSIIYDTNFEENDGDKSYRLELEAIGQGPEGLDKLYEMLKEVDMASTETIHKNNVKRVIRALEYYNQTGEPISVHNEREKKKEAIYNVGFYVLTMEREILYDRINQRVDMMVDAGLVAEVKGLLDQGYDKSLVSMQGLGYKEIVAYLEGHCTLEESLEILKRDTRRFAKRQFTWFKRDPLVQWVDVSLLLKDVNGIVNILLKDIEEKKIL